VIDRQQSVLIIADQKTLCHFVHDTDVVTSKKNWLLYCWFSVNYHLHPASFPTVPVNIKTITTKKFQKKAPAIRLQAAIIFP